MWWSMGAGLIPVPFLDWATVSGLQLKMVAEIAKVYGVPFREDRGKAIIGSLAAFVFPHSIACGIIGSFLKTIPIIGTLSGAPALALLCGAYSRAMGAVFIQHFESGGTFLDFNPAEVREHFKTQFEEGRKMALTMGTAEKAAVKADVPV